MPRTSRLAVGGPAGETTDFGADHKFSPLERMLLTAAVCTEMPAPPTGRALLLRERASELFGAQFDDAMLAPGDDGEQDDGDFADPP